jgi:outer membrane protein insertion porin family
MRGALVALMLALTAHASEARAAGASSSSTSPPRPSPSPAAPVAAGSAPEVLAPPTAPPAPPTTPALEPAPDLTAFVGQPITRIEVSVDDDAWALAATPVVTSVHVGQPFAVALARRAMADVLVSGLFAKARVNAVGDVGGVRLVIHLVQRRLVETLRLEIHGAPVEREEVLRDLDLTEGGEILGVELPEYRRRIERYLARRGFPAPTVTLESRETDEATRVLVVIDVATGVPRVVARRAFYAFDADARELAPTMDTYRVAVGARADESALDLADAALATRLRAKGYHRAVVSHDVVLASGLVTVRVRVDAGPRFAPRFTGNEHYDATALEGALGLDEESDLAPSNLVQKLKDFYVKRGFLDVEVTLETRGTDHDPTHFLVFHVIEHDRVSVTSRAYPCLKTDEIKKLRDGGPKSVGEIGSEIDSYLEEELPGADLIRAPDPRGLDATVRGPAETPRGEPPAPIDLDPVATFAADTYDRAVAHVQELYRNEGYLYAQVGPVFALRRQCDRRSPPGGCIPIAPKPLGAEECKYDATSLPLPVPPLDAAYTCTPDPARGVECEPRVSLRIPIKLGPRTTLYDMTFEGAHAIPETKLAREAALVLGEAANTLKIEDARRRMIEAYKEEGYAYVGIKYTLESSVDHTRARVRFDISEGERVIVRQIVVRGNEITHDWTIRRRIALEVGKPYRTSDVRKTEERIATLNVFSTVTVALEEPYVPQRSKVVIITLAERLPQYLELRPGFSTGEGIRGAFEYGHRNIAGDAIGLSLRAQVSYLPSALILDDQVRKNFNTTLGSGFSGRRLAARLTVGVSFPEIGLGPLVRLNIDGVFVRDLARDFVLQKFAAIPSVIFRPVRQVQFTASQSFERNDVKVFNFDDINAYLEAAAASGRLNADLRRQLRLPNGASFASAQRFVLAFDRRDSTFNPHRGTNFISGVEHIDWYGLDCPAAAEGAPPCGVGPESGHTLKLTETFSAYIPVTRTITLAGALRVGTNVQLAANSSTYPDRRFFLGGVDSMRGWLQDTFVPQEYADGIAAGTLQFERLGILGGDLMINPKLELRVPVRSPVETVLFVDAGNLWRDARYILDHGFTLRYSVGSGIRIQTPIGPLAFDYGINLSRLVSAKTDPRRTYEDFGAFHFAIGLF